MVAGATNDAMGKQAARAGTRLRMSARLPHPFQVPTIMIHNCDSALLKGEMGIFR